MSLRKVSPFAPPMIHTRGSTLCLPAPRGKEKALWPARGGGGRTLGARVVLRDLSRTSMWPMPMPPLGPGPAGPAACEVGGGGR